MRPLLEGKDSAQTMAINREPVTHFWSPEVSVPEYLRASRRIPAGMHAASVEISPPKAAHPESSEAEPQASAEEAVLLAAASAEVVDRRRS